MPPIRIIAESELRCVVQLDHEAIDCIERAFATLSGGKVVMPPILSMPINDHNGEVDVKTAYVPGLESFAIKISPGFFDNPSLGLPSTSGLMVLFSSKTGMLEAVLLDNGYLTDVRTAAAGGVAARHLAREDAATACIVGAGAQARLQLEALCLVRPIREATLWARDPDKAEGVAAELSASLRLPVSSARDLGSAVSRAEIVVTTTPSAEPLIQPDWLRPGQHITAMGSDQAHKSELHPECLIRTNLYVPDRRSQTETLGELRAAIEAGVINPEASFPELGDIVAGAAKGRTSPDEITIADLTGTGLQDTAIATFARARALVAEVGMEMST